MKEYKKHLESLNQNYSLGVITNGNADLKKIGIDHLFSHIFSSANSGAHKPDPKAFEILIEASGLKPEEICHVGDHPLNDVKGSLDCGMKPIWFKNEGAEWPYEDIEIPVFEKWEDFESVLKALIRYYQAYAEQLKIVHHRNNPYTYPLRAFH